MAHETRNSRSARMVAIAEEFLQRLRNGERPDIEEYVNRHPELAEEIRQHLSLLDRASQNGCDLDADTLDSNESLQSIPFHPEELPAGLGRYQLKELLGLGNMGAVYLAHDLELERTVALKIPQLKDARPRELERFYREARAMATVDHPNVCSVYDVAEVQPDDVDADKAGLIGRPFLTMAFIDGTVLSDTVSTVTRWKNDEAAKLVRKIALALQVLHDAGILHRDIKPGNIMLDTKHEPIVMDFGLARRDIATEPEITVQGQVFGSPAYMSPEQVGGEELSSRTDIYSLGVLLYELLCGKRPFTGSQLAVLRDVCWVEPRKPRDVSPEIDRDLEAICLKAMSKKAKDRFASGNDMAAALEKYLTATSRPARTPTGRSKKVLLGLASIAVCALAVLAIIFPDSWKPDSPKTPVVDPAQSLAHMTAADEQIQKELDTILFDTFRRRMHQARAPNIGDAYAKLFARLGIEPGATGDDQLAEVLAGHHADLRPEFLVALESWLQCERRQEDVPADWLRSMLAIYNPEFSLIRDLVDKSGAERREVLTLFNLEKSDPRLAVIFDSALGDAGSKLGQELLTRVHRAHPNNDFVETALGLRLLQNNNVEAAIEPLEAAVELRPCSVAWSHLGLCYVRNKRSNAAIDVLRKAIEADPAYGAAHQFMGRALHQAAMTKPVASPKRIDLLNEAVGSFRKALDHDGDKPGDSHRFLSFSLSELGEFEKAHTARLDAIGYYREFGRWKPATNLYATCLDYLAKAHADDVDQRYDLCRLAHEASLKSKFFGRTRQQMAKLKQYLNRQSPPNDARIRHLEELIQANRKAAAKK